MDSPFRIRKQFAKKLFVTAIIAIAEKVPKTAKFFKMHFEHTNKMGFFHFRF
jgi:hypothetical protein